MTELTILKEKLHLTDTDCNITELRKIYRQNRKKKRHQNIATSRNYLKSKKIKFLEQSEFLWKVGEFYFTPTTGRFQNLDGTKKGIGVKILVKMVRGLYVY